MHWSHVVLKWYTIIVQYFKTYVTSYYYINWGYIYLLCNIFSNVLKNILYGWAFINHMQESPLADPTLSLAYVASIRLSRYNPV